MVEGFKNITQRFSIVDVFAFFIPGAFLALYVCLIDGNTAWNVLFGPVQYVFTDHIIMRIVYFGFMSYVAGMLVSEASWMMEQIFACLVKISDALYNPQGQTQAQSQGQTQRVMIAEVAAIVTAFLGVCLLLKPSLADLKKIGMFALLVCGAVLFSRGVMILLEQGRGAWRRRLLFMPSGAVLAASAACFLWGLSWETTGLLCFIAGGSVLLGQTNAQTNDMEKLKALGQVELFRKAQLFQGYYELFRSFCAAILFLYWRNTVSPTFSEIHLILLFALEFLCAERALRFRKKKDDYYEAHRTCVEETRGMG